MVQNFIEQAAYMAHGYCLLWQPGLVALHAASDLLIFLAYFAIPVAIWMFLKRRDDLELKNLAVLFAAFIFLCGLTHLVQLITLWWPIYETQGVLKAMTAIVSVTTAAMIFPLIPQAVAIPNPKSLQLTNSVLMQEMQAHKRTLQSLEEARSELEHRVKERTRELEQSKARFEALITASAQVFWTTTADGQVEEDSPSWRAFTGQSYDEWKGVGWLEAVHPEDRERSLAAWREAVAGKGIYDIEYRLKHVDGEYRWTNARGVPLLGEDGGISEWVGMNADITPRKRHEENTNLILRELSHRTKNLLAVISSLARRTLDGRRDAKVQALDFVERIQGLSRSHDLLVKGDWQGVSLEELVSSHLEPFVSRTTRVTTEGPYVEVRPEAAQSLGLALHELSTNAAKHGVLKTALGRLTVRWQVMREGDDANLKLEWVEDADVPFDVSRPSGFGRYLLEELVGSALGGGADYVLADRQVRWTLVAPLDRVAKALPQRGARRIEGAQGA